MASSEMLSSLNLVTLLIAVIVVGAGFAYWMRKRANRHPMEGRKDRNVSADIDAGRPASKRSPPE